MAETPSTMLELGTRAPGFELPNTNRLAGVSNVSLADYQGQALIVAFICNHCPYVVLLTEQLAKLAHDWHKAGISLVAISSNDVDNYPADSPEKMKDFSQKYDFAFPYLYDETQQIAMAYKAACTPDFFLFNSSHELVYRGRFDAARPGNGQRVTGLDLDKAVNSLIKGKVIEEDQIPSVGCSIKWKTGNEPRYS